ncbi:MAG: c-type cytochrome [Crocinitomix sp.]|nr:c-type cytochrome [Crocinitomix sp.]
MEKRGGNILVLTILVCVFATYNLVLYLQPTSGSTAPLMSETALEGEKIWQENNCTACHQLYGLGGYLGPDLTNIISHPYKGSGYAKAFFNSGVSSMPKFDFSETEKEALVQFLEHVDRTGYYPNLNAEFGADGWVSIKYK